MKVSIIIPNYNGKALLEKNLLSVVKAKGVSGNQVGEIIVVDDCSTDGSTLYLKERFPEIRLIKHTINRGFSAAVNTGVRSSRGELVCLLNTDVIPNEDFLIATLPHFENPNVFAVSLHEEGYGWAKGDFKDGFVIHSPGKELEKTHRTFWVSGGSGVFRRSQWIKLGGLDEKLFSPFYWEDIDIGYRAHKRGMSLLWEPKSHVTHEHEATVKKLSKRYVDRIRERNQLLFIWKNITSVNLTRRHIANLIKRIITHPGYILVFLSALKKIRKVQKARDRESKEAKISDEAVFASFK